MNLYLGGITHESVMAECADLTSCCKNHKIAFNSSDGLICYALRSLFLPRFHEAADSARPIYQEVYWWFATQLRHPYAF